MWMQSGSSRPYAATILGGVLLVASLSGTPSLAKEKDPPPDLTGIWRLNEEKSESLQEKMEEMRGKMGGRMGGMRGGMGGGMGGRGGMGPGGMGGGMGGRGGMGPGGPEGDGAGRDPAMESLARPPLLMTLEQSDTEVIVSERGRTLRRFSFQEADGATPTLESMRARWKGKRLEANGTSERGRTLQESYTLESDGKTLVVVSRVKTPRGDLELKRVYERYEGD